MDGAEASVFFKAVQDEICAALAEADGAGAFREDLWSRPGGGGGRSRVLTGGALLEKAGVSWSHVHGQLSEQMDGALPGTGKRFSATGISLVLHPLSPRVPTTHANFRFIEKGDEAWFGGGADLTPYYPYLSDVRHFHQTFKDTCDAHDPTWYGRFKRWCDQYFYLPHRGEARGVGGIFFDYLGVPADRLPSSVRSHAHLAVPEAVDRDAAFAFVRDAAGAFLQAYLPIAARRREEPYGEAERRFQLVRRGRYVEFNLLYDRGTVFGLRTGGRTESILMSLPPLVRWDYAHEPDEGSREAELARFLVARDWLSDEPLSGGDASD